MKIQNLVVGAGFAGSVVARRIAEEKGEEVLVVERRGHAGGNARDLYDGHGVLIHEYGPHIFHTGDEGVWAWLSRFTEWRPYQHRVLSYVDGMLVPLPVGPYTVNALLGLSLGAEGFRGWLAAQRSGRGVAAAGSAAAGSAAAQAAAARGEADGAAATEAANAEEEFLSQAGPWIYEKFFKNYTRKQWGRPAAELDAAVAKRIPFRDGRDTRYFADKYQGLPKRGYSALFERILDHPRIHLLLNTDWEALRGKVEYGRLYYTGPLDAFFGRRHGPLPYRSVRFEYETFFDREYYQPAGTVNYPNDYDFTRITEYKRLTGQAVACTTIAREYSQAEGEPFYVVPGREGAEALAAYRREAEGLRDVAFVGRLAEYRYYNMDAVVRRALSLRLD